MISHQHKCIFVHISKCAGTSIEKALGQQGKELDTDLLYGWSDTHKLYLQHATPQQLLDLGCITKEQWDSYFKFVVVRNPWDRASSDYLWVIKTQQVYDSFKNFLGAKGKFAKYLSAATPYNVADHLYAQVDYLFLNGQRIDYDMVLRFENLKTELPRLAEKLGLDSEVFTRKKNVNQRRFPHYSFFYNMKKRKLVSKKYREDIDHLNYQFEDKKNGLATLKAGFTAFFHPDRKILLRYKYPKLVGIWYKIKQ